MVTLVTPERFDVKKITERERLLDKTNVLGAQKCNCLIKTFSVYHLYKPKRLVSDRQYSRVETVVSYFRRYLSTSLLRPIPVPDSKNLGTIGYGLYKDGRRI